MPLCPIAPFSVMPACLNPLTLALTRSPFLQADEALARCVDAWDECDDPETPQVVELVAAPIP